MVLVLSGIATAIAYTARTSGVAAGTAMMRMQLAISWATTIGTMLVTVAIGALAGYLPARHAADIPPADSLRTVA
ncbi:MAG: hypothetical protein ACREOJ_15590 [Gemmatimonadaceae bacterium]